MNKKKITPSLDLSPAKVQALAANWDGEGAKEFQAIFDQVKGTPEGDAFFNACVEARVSVKLIDWNKVKIDNITDKIELERVIKLQEQNLADFIEDNIGHSEIQFGDNNKYTTPGDKANPAYKGHRYAVLKNTDYSDIPAFWPRVEYITLDCIADGVTRCRMEDNLERLKHTKPGKAKTKKSVTPPKVQILRFLNFLYDADSLHYRELTSNGRSRRTYGEHIFELFGLGEFTKSDRSAFGNPGKMKIRPKQLEAIRQNVLPILKNDNPDLLHAVSKAIEDHIKALHGTRK